MDEEKRVAEELISVMRVLRELFPPGADEKIVIDSEVYEQIKSKRRLTLKHCICYLFKMINIKLRGFYMKRLIFFIILTSLLLSSCSNTANLKKTKVFTVKAIDNDKAWSRAHTWIYKNGTYEYLRVNDYTISSMNYIDSMTLGITREAYGSDFRYTIILAGIAILNYDKPFFEQVYRSKERWVEMKKKEIDSEMDVIKDYILTGNSNKPNVN